MRYLGIDWGEKRWGISYGDELGVATPLHAIVDNEVADRWNSLIRLVKERRIEGFVVGYPFNMDGSVGFKAREVDGFIDQLGDRFPNIPVERADERLTSHTAGQHWNSKQKRQQRKSGKLDSGAATVFLQDFLDQLNFDISPEYLEDGDGLI